MIFRYEEYREFLAHMQATGPVTSIGGWDGRSRSILLRHDVDLDVGAAHRLARLEARADLTSSYFFLVTGHTYNPFSQVNRRLIKEMADLGFEIGLHFDPTVYGAVDEVGLQEKVVEEAGMLASVAGAPIRSISLHNPSVHGQYPLFDGFRNAYDPDIFSETAYLSDSRMRFRSSPYDFVQRVAAHPVQILLHPLHYTESGGDYPEIFYQTLKAAIQALDKDFRINSTFQESLGDTALFAYLTERAVREAGS